MEVVGVEEVEGVKEEVVGDREEVSGVERGG